MSCLKTITIIIILGLALGTIYQIALFIDTKYYDGENIIKPEDLWLAKIINYIENYQDNKMEESSNPNKEPEK